MSHNKGQIFPILVFLICVSLGIGSIWVSLNFKPEGKEAETYVSYSDTGKFVNVSGCTLGDMSLTQADSCHDGLNGTEYCDLGNLSCTIPSQNTVWSAYKFICEEMNISGECGNVPNGGQNPIDSDKILSGTMEITQEDIDVCGRWIQIDIFDKDCNPNNENDWECGTPLDFFNYYTGNCVCNDIELKAYNRDGGSIGIGTTVRLEIVGSASTEVRDTITGLGTAISCPLKTDGTIDFDWNDPAYAGGKIDCVVNQAGEYSWTHFWKNCEADPNNCSDECNESVSFQVIVDPTPTPTPTPTPRPLTCSDLSTSSTSFKRGETITLTCSGSGTNASYANFKIDGLNLTKNNIPLSSGLATTTMIIPIDAERLGPYTAQCQICGLENINDSNSAICTEWGKAEVLTY